MPLKQTLCEVDSWRVSFKVQIDLCTFVLSSYIPAVFFRSIRILHQMLEHLQLEAVFAWLSTLGGAHSALGDYFNKNVNTCTMHLIFKGKCVLSLSRTHTHVENLNQEQLWKIHQLQVLW